MPALTVNAYGEGEAYYVATAPEPKLLADLTRTLCEKHQIAAPFKAGEGVELAQRRKGDQLYTFVLNHNRAPAAIELEETVYVDLLTRCTVSGTKEIEPYGVMILQKV